MKVKSHYKRFHVKDPMILGDYERFHCFECSDFFFGQHELDKHKAFEVRYYHFSTIHLHFMYLLRTQLLGTNTGELMKHRSVASKNYTHQANFLDLMNYVVDPLGLPLVLVRVGLRLRHVYHIYILHYLCTYKQFKVGLIKIQHS